MVTTHFPPIFPHPYCNQNPHERLSRRPPQDMSKKLAMLGADVREGSELQKSNQNTSKRHETPSVSAPVFSTFLGDLGGVSETVAHESTCMVENRGRNREKAGRPGARAHVGRMHPRPLGVAFSTHHQGWPFPLLIVLKARQLPATGGAETERKAPKKLLAAGNSCA